MMMVSIHAPTRGATTISSTTLLWHLFQSTRPRGARRQVHHHRGQHQRGFNPRAHAGRDLLLLCVGSMSRVSIHAPTRGAT